MSEFLKKACWCYRYHAAGKVSSLLYCVPCVAFLSAIVLAQVYLFVAVVLK